MRVILLKDIENLGKKYDVKQVKTGYAKNFLIPKGLAKRATKENLDWLEAQREKEAEKAEKELKGFQGLASKLDGQEVSFTLRVGEKGEVFGSVNVLKISRELKDLGFKIKKSQVGLAEPIKELGEFPVKINLPHGLEAEIKVIVEEEVVEEEEEEEEKK